MRAWLLSNTTYGTWLPGDWRGSVTSVRDQRPGDLPQIVRFEHDLPGEPYEDELPGLNAHAKNNLSGPPIWLEIAHAVALLAQFQETATYRTWTLRAVAIMSNHFHIVMQVTSDPHPRKILADFKAYGTRTLNRDFGRRPSESWWTENGSKRFLADDRALAAAIYYVLYKQPNPLVVWCPELGRIA